MPCFLEIIGVARKEVNMENETVACRLCGQPTMMLGTKLCDRCWELETRIEMAPDIAKRIIAALEAKESTAHLTTAAGRNAV